ncbi:MAG: hypothetical protein VYA55_01240 [Pseudomonadota bacterium]|nr:hypothetical protein [Pseudomonadota bacterium]
MKTSYTRRLSLADLTYAASGYRSSHKNQLLCQLIVRGQGRIPEHRMLDAAAEVSRYCPIMRSRLKGVWFAKYWSASGPLPRVRTVNLDWDGQCQEGLDFIDTPLDLIVGPVAEIVQVVGRSTYIVFRAHHAITDGIGMLEFAQAFFKVLNGAEPVYYGSPVTLEKMPPGNLEAIPPGVSAASTPYPLAQENPELIRRERIWRQLTLPGNDKKILLKVMLALSAMARGKDSGAVRLHMPVSLRRYVPNENTLANLFGMLRIDVNVGDDEKVLVKKIKRAMADRQELPIAVNSVTSKLAFLFPLLALHFLEKLAIKKLLGRPRFRCSATTSYGGTLNLQEFSTEHFTAKTVFGIPVPPLGTPLMVAIMSNENSTEIVVSANRTLISDESMDQLVQQLHDLIQGYSTRSRATKTELQAVVNG